MSSGSNSRVSEPEPSLWPGSGSSFNFSFITHANCMVYGYIITVCSQEPKLAPRKKFPEPPVQQKLNYAGIRLL